MTDDEPDRDRNSFDFEEIARTLAEEVSRAVDRLSQIDVEEIARTASAEADRARRWVDELGQWLREQADVAASGSFGAAEAWRSRPAGTERPAADDPLRSAGPDPLDLPTAEQGRALAALDSGRWRLEPGTSTIAVRGEGPGPSDALGLVRELRVRDWISADGELTLAGRSALRRWLEAAERA